jgi:hypothetical protein
VRQRRKRLPPSAPLYADPTCNGGRPGTFMPYGQMRCLTASHWPAAPSEGQHLPPKPVTTPPPPQAQP